MSAEIGRTTRVIGWYHSHPHITVMPSHVGERHFLALWLRNYHHTFRLNVKAR